MAGKFFRSDRIIRILSSLVVLIFAAILVVRFSPWGWPESGNAAPAGSASVEASETQNVVHATLQLKDGPVELELWPDVAPLHVAQVSALIADGFYDGIVFHRVIDGFMAQTGDPTGTGMGGSDLPDIPAEFSDVPFERGVLGMARSSDPNSANSQFFIMFSDAPHLNGQYTAFGRVVAGMEHVDAIRKGDPAQNGLVNNPDRIVTMTLGD